MLSVRRHASAAVFSALTTLLVQVATVQAQTAPAAAKVKRFEGTAALGYSQTSGNADATAINLSNKLKYTLRGWSMAQDLVFFYGEANNKVNANFWTAGLRAERRLTPRLGTYVVTRFDRNVLQGISRRFEEGVGLDYKLADAPNDKLTLALGASAFQQTLTPGSSSAFAGSFPAARTAMDYKHLFSAKAYFQQTAEYLPNLSESQAFLLNSESALVAPLVSALAVKIGYVQRYNARPPVRNGVALKKTDTFFSTAITYTF
jgi:putative salt-induced outer membrane protein